MQNQVQLITYADRLGGHRLDALHDTLRGPLAGLFGGIHILPFFDPIDGADAGFDPIDHTIVDPRLGDWGSIQALSQDLPIMADLIVNHVSAKSPQFEDFLRNGEESPYAEMFLTLARVFPHGASEDDLLRIYRPRPGLPFTPVTLRNGKRRLLWTTFTNQQIDIDVTHPQGQSYLTKILHTFQQHGVSSIRLDAVGYALKKPGSSCFMIPETFEFVETLAAQAGALGMEVLVEVHSYYRDQIEIARRVDRVYDFALPPLILHAFFHHTATALKRWLVQSPRNAITVLDTHDGIGVIDIGASGDRPGLVPPNEIDTLVETIHERSNGQSRMATGAAASNLDLYQVNCTYYDALGRNDQEYLLARAIQFFAPGIPQVYYVGLLAGGNDMERLQQTQVGREINRHVFSREEISAAIQRPIVQELFRLIRFRNEHPAFNGEFHLLESDPACIAMRWENGPDWAQLDVDFRDTSYSLRASQNG